MKKHLITASLLGICFVLATLMSACKSVPACNPKKMVVKSSVVAPEKLRDSIYVGDVAGWKGGSSAENAVETLRIDSADLRKAVGIALFNSGFYQSEKEWSAYQLSVTVSHVSVTRKSRNFHVEVEMAFALVDTETGRRAFYDMISTTINAGKNPSRIGMAQEKAVSVTIGKFLQQLASKPGKSAGTNGKLKAIDEDDEVVSGAFDESENEDAETLLEEVESSPKRTKRP